MFPARSSFGAALTALIGLPLCLAVPSRTTAQPRADTLRADTTKITPDLESVLDALDTEEQTATLAAERVADLRNHPVALNRAPATDLSILPHLSVRDAHRIVQYRSRNGPFGTLDELQGVAGLDAATVLDVPWSSLVGPFQGVAQGRRRLSFQIDWTASAEDGQNPETLPPPPDAPRRSPVLRTGPTPSGVGSHRHTAAGRAVSLADRRPRYLLGVSSI